MLKNIVKVNAFIELIIKVVHTPYFEKSIVTAYIYTTHWQSFFFIYIFEKK